MIWYLLYPFRGTTEPPVLSPSHPIRRFFSRHGSIVARHPVRWILISVVLAIVLCYPIVFLYSHSYTTSIANLPHHVWTSARPLGAAKGVVPDIDVRQAWVHGSYMRALEPEVLSEAVHIQDALLGPDLGCEFPQRVDALVRTSKGKFTPAMPDKQPASRMDDHKTDIISFFHSALMYWNCSVSAINEDVDLIETVNARSHSMSSANVTLRHSSVFAGKSFSRDQLIAADGLVISFFYTDSTLGDLWESRAEELAKQVDRRWSLYPFDGRVKNFELYEYRFEPMSVKEDILLGVAYALMVLYVAMSLRRLKAVKSQLGLAATVITQIGISILSSFTICVVSKVDLSRVPREAYPFVVLVIGIENMFRLMNAVLLAPPEASTISRMSHALGDIGHLSLAGATQNLIILWLLSKAVSRGVAAFCTFSSIALILDYFFHLTFFLAVLSVDVQRMELQDSLDRVSLSQRTAKRSDDGKQKWSGVLYRSKLPFSTRIAGSALMVCFISILNWHFFDNKNPLELMPLLSLFRAQDPQPTRETFSILSVPINQARSPTSWLRLQDHDTTKEIIQVVKPFSHNLIVRVYDPLIFVLKGANRGQPESPSHEFPFSLFPALPGTVKEHMQPFVLLIVLAVAVVALLMNYLLWDELSDDNSELLKYLEPSFSAKTYTGGHILDVAMVSSPSAGSLISVGLDRRIVLWNLRTGWSFNLSENVQLTKTDMFWPVVAVAGDDRGRWLAICSGSGLISVWNFQDQSIKQFTHFDLGGQQPSVFTFTPDRETQTSKLVFIRADGWLGELDPRTSEVSKRKIVNGRVVSAYTSFTPKSPPKILAVTKAGCIYAITRAGDTWFAEKLGVVDGLQLAENSTLTISVILPIPALGMLMAVGRSEARLLDLRTLSSIHIFQTSQIKTHSLCVIHSTKRQCSTCGTGFGVCSFSILYAEYETQTLMMHTFTPGSTEKNLICFGPPKGSTGSGCKGFGNATETVHNMRGAGVWEATSANNVIGIRKKAVSPRHRDHTTLQSYPRGRVRRRGTRQEAPKSAEDDYEWEAWVMSANGEVNALPLHPDIGDGQELFVSKIGPICKVGKGSVVVGFGTSVKLLMAGNERFDGRGAEMGDPPFASVGHRKKLHARRSQ